MFTPAEVEYMNSQRLARIATVSSQGQPDAAPVIFELDGSIIYIGGVKPDNSRKYRNVRAGNTRIALVIDDLESVVPWKPRGIRIFGSADFIERSGQFGQGTYMRITPNVSWSWNIEEPSLKDGKFTPNRITHSIGDQPSAGSSPAK